MYEWKKYSLVGGKPAPVRYVHPTPGQPGFSFGFRAENQAPKYYKYGWYLDHFALLYYLQRFD